MALEQVLTYRAQAETAPDLDKPAERYDFGCCSNTTVVPTLVSPFELAARCTWQYRCPKLSSIDRMSEPCMRSMLYREIYRKLSVDPARESLIAGAISASSTGKLQLH